MKLLPGGEGNGLEYESGLETGIAGVGLDLTREMSDSLQLCHAGGPVKRPTGMQRQ